MTNIQWINCSERMPPRTMDAKIIYRISGQLKGINHGQVLCCIADNHMRWEEVKNLFDWISYDEEIWKELNK